MPAVYLAAPRVDPNGARKRVLALLARSYAPVCTESNHHSSDRNLNGDV